MATRASGHFRRPFRSPSLGGRDFGGVANTPAAPLSLYPSKKSPALGGAKFGGQRPPGWPKANASVAPAYLRNANEGHHRRLWCAACDGKGRCEIDARRALGCDRHLD